MTTASSSTPRLTDVSETPDTDPVAERTGEIPVAESPVWESGALRPVAFLLPAVGGCGVSTLAHSLAQFAETSVFPAADTPNTVAVVTTASYTGLDAAHRIIRQVQAGRAGGCQLVGLVVVNTTGGKIPKAVTQRTAAVAANVSRVWTVDYIEHWRCVPLAELPVWNPRTSTRGGESRGARGRRKKTTAADEVPEQVVETALQISREAVDLYEALK